MKRAKRNLKSIFARKRRRLVKFIKRVKFIKQKKEDEKRFRHQVEKDIQRSSSNE